MHLEAITGWVVSSLFVGLRVAPVFALAPPFTLTTVPPLFRVLLGLGLSGALAAAYPATAALGDFGAAHLLLTAVRELMLGSIFVLAFQLMFGGLYVAGRVVDIQAGFGLATLIDPTTQNQTPLVGTLFAYGAAAVFFALDGHLELLRVLGASLQALPLGTAQFPGSLGALTSFVSIVFITSLGVAGGSILALFLADLTISLLSRTVPQMNVLVLGLQVKTLLLLVVLPLSFGAAGALFARLTRLTLEALPRLL